MKILGVLISVVMSVLISQSAQADQYRLEDLNAGSGLLFVPANYKSTSKSPLMVSLHGNRGEAAGQLEMLRSYAEANGTILIVPKSVDRTWDKIITKKFGPDLKNLNAALAYTLKNFNIDEKRIAINGFSDGASYALAVGLGKGNLFTHIAAFAPGSARARNYVGKPKVFIAHGIADDILPIDKCSRKIVPRLAARNYNMTYIEFDGRHEVPEHIKAQMMEWFLNQRKQR